MADQQETPAGWYQDPTGEIQERYWSGSEWTEETRPYAPPASSATEAARVTAASHQPRPASPSPQGSPGTTPQQVALPGAGSHEAANRGRSLLAVGLSLALLGGLIVGVVMWRRGVDESARRAAAAGASIGEPGLPAFTQQPTVPNFLGYTVKYEVNGSAGEVSITYQTDAGSTQEDARTPWTYTRSGALVGDFVYVSAQDGSGEAAATTTCTVYVNGVEVLTNTARGAYKIATCSGTL